MKLSQNKASVRAVADQLMDSLSSLHGAVLRQAMLPREEWEANRNDAYRALAKELLRAAEDAIK